MTVLDSALFWQRKWDLWKAAKQFPTLYARCNYVLAFELGRDDFGFSYANSGRNYTGPALDLSGSTVKLICEKMPVKPGLLDASRGEGWTQTTEVFTVAGVIQGSDSGEVNFTLTASHTDTLGNCLAQIEVTDADGNVFVPGMVRMKFLEKLG